MINGDEIGKYYVHIGGGGGERRPAEPIFIVYINNTKNNNVKNYGMSRGANTCVRVRGTKEGGDSVRHFE